jgi:GLPGLI family protein
LAQFKEGTSVLYKYNDLFLQITINGEKKKLPDRYCRMVFTDSLSFTYRYNEANKDPFRKKTVFGAFPGIATFYAVSNHNRITVVEKKRKIYQTTDTTQFYKWELFDDTKIVAGFLCRSALTFRNQTDSVIAWYTTEIPGSFGPGWFTGLPGIVLELQDNHTGDRFTAIKVEPLKLEIRLPENAITVKDLHRLK